MSELKPCPCDLSPLNDRILNLGSGLATMPEGGTMQVNKAFLAAILSYMEELLGMRRAQPANDPLTLDEMNALDHEPIYVLHTGGKWTMNGWHIATASSYQNHGRCDLEIDNGNTIIDTQNYGKTWLAYRRPPERSENDGL